MDSGGNDRGIEAATRQATGDRVLHMFDGVVGQQLQHADVMSRSQARSVLLFQRTPESVKDTRQLPVAIYRCVIESAGLTFQNHQEMERIEYLLPSLVTAEVGGDGRSFTDHFDAVHISLHTHRSKRPSTRHAVAVAIESDRLVLVHLARLYDARIEAMAGWRQRQSRGSVLFESLAD